MAKIGQQGQPGGGGGTYQETAEQRDAWRKLRTYMRSLNLGVGDTFTVKGTIAKVLLDGTADHPRYFTKPQVKDDGSTYDWPYVKVMAAITDPQFGKPGTLDFPAKNVGASFFDGVTKKGRSPNRGGMYNLHVAVTGEEPSQALKDGKGDWDTEDYENKPLLLRLVYQGKEEEGSAYADRRLGMKLFIAGFEKDRDVHRASSDLDDEDDAAPFPTPSGTGSSHTGATNGSGDGAKIAAARSSASATVTQDANLAVTPATERQVRFIYALGREAGLDDSAVNDWALELFGREVDGLNRRDASALIDALQLRRTEVEDNPLPRQLAAEDGKGEPVGVGVSERPLEDDDTDF